MAELKKSQEVKMLSWFILLALSFGSISGCWDRHELEDMAFVQALGIDKGPNNQMLVTFRMSIPSKIGLGQSSGGGGGGDSKSTLITTIAAPTVPAAIALASGYINRDLNMMHTKVFIIGEPFAREGVQPILSVLVRFREFRRNSMMVITKGEAYKVINTNKPDMEKSLFKYWEGVKLLESELAITPGTLMQEFVTDLETEGDKAGVTISFAVNRNAGASEAGKIKVPTAFKQGHLDVKAGEIPRTGGNLVEYIGAAAFKDDKLVDFMGFEETQVMLMLQGRFKRTFVTIPDPRQDNKFVSLEVKQGAPPIVKVETANEGIRIREKISLEGDLLTIQSPVNYATDLENQEELELAVRDHLMEHADKMLSRFQKQGVDLVGYGDYAQRNFLTRQQFRDFDWRDKYKNARFDLEFSFDIRRTGIQGGQPVIEQEQGTS